jgi:hypothetical protein
MTSRNSGEKEVDAMSPVSWILYRSFVSSVCYSELHVNEKLQYGYERGRKWREAEEN